MEPQLGIGWIEILGTAAVAVIAVIFTVQKLLKGWKESSTESSVISIMHTELERMARQNTTLTTELNKLQIELVTLNSELRKLTLENQQLHAEVAALTAQVTHLQATLRVKGE